MMNKSEEQLLHIVLNNLMSLPAYKLQTKYREIFEKYVYTKLERSIQKNTLEKAHTVIDNNDLKNQSISAIYQKPNRWNILVFSFKSLPKIYKSIGWIAMISFACGLFSRASNPLLTLFGVISVLIFSFSFLIYGVQVSVWYSYVENSFSILNRILDDINDYIHNFGDINEKNLYTRANIILENIIKDEISSLNYNLKQINIFNILFAFSISFLFVYILGDSPIEGIKWIASILNLGDFEYIKELNIEKFAIFILFPLGIALSKDIVISGLKERNKRLRRSLVIVMNRIQEQYFFTIQPQRFTSTNYKYPTEFVQDTLLAAAIYFYQKGEISMEKAAKMADLNIRDFLEVLARKKIDVFTVDFEDLDQELERG